MKKLLIAIISISLLISMLSGCGNSKNDDQAQQNGLDKENSTMQGSPNHTDQNGQDTDLKDDPDTPVSNGTQSPSDTTANQGGVTGNQKDPITKPSTTPDTSTTQNKPSTPATKPTTKPNTTPATKPTVPPNKPVQPPVKPEKSYSISEVHKLVKKTYGSDYLANAAISKADLGSLMGINTAEISEFIAEQPMISANIDTFVAIKAASGKGASIASALNAYKAKLTSPEACMYPSNIPKAQAAQVVRHGDYVFLVMLGASGDSSADEASQLKFAKAQVQKGVNAINQYFSK